MVLPHAVSICEWIREERLGRSAAVAGVKITMGALGWARVFSRSTTAKDTTPSPVPSSSPEHRQLVFPILVSSYWTLSTNMHVPITDKTFTLNFTFSAVVVDQLGRYFPITGRPCDQNEADPSNVGPAREGDVCRHGWAAKYDHRGCQWTCRCIYSDGL